MHRPDNYLTKVQPNAPAHNQTQRSLETRATGRINGAYFTNWGIYSTPAYTPQLIPVSKLSHIFYSFADVTPSTGNVFLSDTYSDQEIHYNGDSWSETGTNLYGNFKQLYLLKKANRGLKVILSVGGWTYSQAGHFSFITNPSLRANFVTSAINLVEDNGLDGIDIDFEYPAAGAQSQGFTALLAELRTGFDNHAKKKGDTVPYQITIAVAAGASNYKALDIAGVDKSISFWNFMGYDYSGEWSTVSDDQANLYPGTQSGADTDTAVSYYLSKGATPSKFVIGLPLYGRSFEKTNGIRQPFSGVGNGQYDYKVLPLAGATVTENTALGSSYSYDAAKKELVSYDTPNIAALKANYAIKRGLGGTFFWEISEDKTDGNSLVSKTASVLGALDNTQNHLNYPYSKFANLKNGMK
ncbi:glycoside hydrolase family 18 protein [Botryobasidium botryosum FD-172 SS1]|uniref:Glycoside hydrolase family 18 protein n=1 Tax=Botryobasidium botryosum (strain FD-172 SS1) TaxID=930990 RepID=A0A067N512_BOTB1|nr:glycoside hydrolase family 18 protein [Botryobasidium botryosum FD-172 SS1]